MGKFYFNIYQRERERESRVSKRKVHRVGSFLTVSQPVSQSVSLNAELQRLIEVDQPKNSQLRPCEVHIQLSLRKIYITNMLPRSLELYMALFCDELHGSSRAVQLARLSSLIILAKILLDVTHTSSVQTCKSPGNTTGPTGQLAEDLPSVGNQLWIVKLLKSMSSPF